MEHGLARHWALPLRIILGIGFMIHGAPKLFGGHQQFQGTLDNLGVPASSLMAWVVGLLEFLGGIALVLGAFTWLVAALLAVEMVFAILLVHLSRGGSEVPLLYMAGLLALLLGGPGPLSVDARAGQGRTALHAPWIRRRAHA